MYQQLRLNNRLMFKKTKDKDLTAKTPRHEETSAVGAAYL
jgi:hypothetical protein